MPKFSIIVPTRNESEFINKSLSSVLTQEYDDYELIVVCDDCDFWEEKYVKQMDPHILVVSVNYHRDGLARNAGLDVAKGDWILFLDDDDWLMHEYVLQMLDEVIGKNGEDILNFSFVWKNVGYKQQTLSELFVMAWCRCYKRDFIGGARFSDKQYGSDKDFYEALMQKKPNITFWNTPMYYYNYMRKGSLTEQKGRERS